MHSAQIQDDISPCVAPKPWAALKMIAIELVKPTSVATKPAVKAVTERSLHHWRGES